MKRQHTYAGLGIIFGAAIGALLFALTGSVLLMACGPAVGLVLGAGVDAALAGRGAGPRGRQGRE
ncbi:MAG TPA: hypothetical protein PKD53_27335 [Chloroflexaceae bacterium]|nr:hypothetical protein [Chloroflexaceae bacterium]